MATKAPKQVRTYGLDDLISEGINYIPAQEQAPEVAPPESSGLIRRIAGDGIVTAMKGAIGVPEAAVGLADLVSGGAAGKMLENEGGDVGFRPKQAKEYLDTLYSPEQRAAFAAVQNAANPEDPFLKRAADIAGAAISNPSTIVHAVGESLPLMGAGGVIGRGLMAVAPKAATWAAGGIGEGVTAMGSGAEQVRQQTEDGYLTPTQAGVAAVSGVATGALGMIAGKVANKLGIGDIDTMMAGGAHVDAGMQKNFFRKVLEGAFSEGVLEELPQSVQEQVSQNYALGKPLDEGVDNAAVMGLLTGGVMGAGANVISRPKVPEVGPLSRGANVNPAMPAAAAGTPMTAPAMAFTPEQEAALLAHANDRRTVLDAKAKGTKEIKTAGPDGKEQIIPAVQPEYLTTAEKKEIDFLNQAGGDAKALALAYPGLLPTAAAPIDIAETTPAADPMPPVDAPAGPVDDQAAIAKMERDSKREMGAANARSRAADDTAPTVVSGAPAAAAPPAAEPDVSKQDDEDGFDPQMPHQDDILNPEGTPFKQTMAARRAIAKQPDPENFAIIPVAGGYAVRRLGTAITGSTTAPEAESAPQPAAIGTQTTVKAGPGFTAADVINGTNKKAGTTAGAKTQAPADQAPTAEDSDAKTAVAVPGAGSGAVEAPGVAPDDNFLRNTEGKWVPPEDAWIDSLTNGFAPKLDKEGNLKLNQHGEITLSNGDAIQTVRPNQIDGFKSAFAKFNGSTANPAALPQAKTNPQPTTLGAAGQSVQPTGTRGTQAGDILNPKGEPFKEKAAAVLAQKKHGGDIVELADGWAVRPQPTALTGAIVYGQPAGTRGTNAGDLKLSLGTVPSEKPAEIEQVTAETTADDVEIAQTHDIVEHTTAKGKILRGVVRTDLTLEQAKEIDQFTFKKDGGFFIREKHIDQLPPVAGEAKAPEKTSGPGTIAEPVAPATPKEPVEPKAPAEPKAPKEVKVHPFAEKWDAMPVDARKELLRGLGQDGKDMTIHANNAWDGLTGVLQRAIVKSQKAEKEENPADTMAELIDGSDAQGIAELAYEGVREAQPEDFPVVLADDRLIRMPVLIAEHEKVEANLKKLGFRVTDRAQESGTAGRIMVSAIYRPDAGTIGDAGEQMAGGRKSQEKPEVPPKDAGDKALDTFIAALHKNNFLDPNSNPVQSFGTMMFKEALMESIKTPLEFIGRVIQRTYGEYYGMKSFREILKKALKNDTHRDRIKTLADEYTQRLMTLQSTLAPATTVAETLEAFKAVYVDPTTYRATKEGADLERVSHGMLTRTVGDYAKKFGIDEHSTDQTNRVKKKDPDVPPRLERIIRVGMKDHRQGRNIVDDDFLNTFGFRGLEFGNWVNQDERQANLNLAYDSLMDLSDITGLSPKSLGIAQKLGFAIGARGQNPRAAAHYEPDNKVINLTKTKGNGTVGHEWFHAFDGIAPTTQDRATFASQEARKAVEALAAALTRNMDPAIGDNYLRSLLRSMSTDSNRNTPPKQAVFEAIAGNPQYRWSAPEAYNGSLFKTTGFFQAARAMDSGSDKNYWSTPVEMLARGFETFLFDASKGGSPYLVGPSRGDGVMTEKNGYSGKPYPSGDERVYVGELFKTFIESFDPVTLEFKSYHPVFKVKEVPGMGWTVLDQHGVDIRSTEGRMTVFKKESEAMEQVVNAGDTKRFLNAERIANGKLNKSYRDFALNIDKIMEEMGLEKWPELKNGSMAESMFFHLRQGWYPENNQALKVYAAKAYGIKPSEIDLLKLKQAQEDFEAALGKYAAQRIVDMRSTGADSRSIYDYLVGLYNKQPNLDVRTGTSQANMAFSTPLPIGYVAGMMGHVTTAKIVFDATGGNGLLVITANPKRVVTVEMEPARANNLRLMEYGKVIEGDATKKIATDVREQEADTVLMNPPFGALAQSVAVPSWDGREFLMSKIDHLIAAQGMKAMADKGHAVIVLGAHKLAGTITSTDRVFLNWLYSNYNVVDHFEVDGSLYARQGANWPLRILVVAGRNQTVSAFPIDTKVDRVNDFEQLWSRSDEARKRAEQVVVGSGVTSDEAGSTNPNGSGLPTGNQGKTAGPDGKGNGPTQNGDVADGAAGSGSGANGGLGKSGGTNTGDSQRGGNGTGGVAGNGSTGKTTPGNGRRGGTVGPEPRGLSDLTDDDLDALIAAAMGGDKPKRAPKVGGETTAGPTGEKAPAAPRTPKGTASAPKLGPSILDSIPGLEGLLGDLGAAMNDGQTPPDDTPPTPPAGKKKKAPAIERREKLKADRAQTTETAGNALTAKKDAPLQLGYTPKSAQLTGAGLDALSQYRASQAQLARAAQAALAWQQEQDTNPVDPNAKVSSRVMFSRQMQEDVQYGKVQPILSAIWQHLGKTIDSIAERIKTLVVGASQKFGASIVPFVKRFIQSVRAEEQIVPNRKKPIKAEAIDNEAQVVYRGRSNGDSSGIFVPRNQAIALERAFDAFEAENGEVDPFVMKELGFDSIDDMHKGPKRGPAQGLAGYQVDALALAISSMKRGDGFIIGDDTGVGKGRTGAALIAWAVKNGKVPIFFSYKSDLYSAMHDDMTDIGMVDSVKPMPTDSDAVIRDRKGNTILKNDAKSTKKDLEHIIQTGTMPSGKNALFTTYFQNNTANLRRQAIQRLVKDGKAVIIMDEAHNAAGESSTNQFFMGLLTGQGLFGGNEKDGFEPAPDDWVAPQTSYLTATFAKRPSNMPVYIRTQLRHAANTPQDLVDLFGSGGDVLQQIASEMLVSSGSMIRRERSYAGVKFNYVTDEENAPRDSREVDAATAVLRQIVYADRAFGTWVKTPEGQSALATLVPPGSSAIASGSNADTAINKSEFTSVVHNYVGQLLLATKVNKAVESAITAINAGQKPVLTLQNTMEAALNDYVSMAGIADGDPLTGFGWQSILTRGLTSARRVVFDSGTGNKKDNIRIMVPTEMMPPSIAAEFARTEGLIANFKSELPGSPIDALRHRLGEYHIVETKGEDGETKYTATKTPPAGSKSRPLIAVEVTGREFGVDYSTKVPSYMRRQDPDNLEIIRGFQGGGIDVVILNSSGSTGISLHASEMAADQRPRHMIVLQPNPDIAVFKQTTGRIHRTGQVEWPTFTVLATGIPAERRALAILKKKIGALFSNTSSGEGSTNVDAVDFINDYGDIITAQYLEDNPDVAKFIGVAQPATPEGSDIARKASGRAALLSVDEQRDYFDTIEQQFLMEIEQRNATGTNKLARRAMDFQASPAEMQVLEEGMDEENPFTSSAYLTKYEINVIGDIPSAEKVRDAIASALDGKTQKDVANALVSSMAIRYDEALNQLTLRRAEVAAGSTDEKATEQEKKALVERLAAMETTIKGFSARREQTISQLQRNLGIGNGVDNMKVGDVESKAVITGVTIGKSTSKVGNPFAPSNIIIHFQRNVPGGRLSVPLSKIENNEYEMTGWTRTPDIADWFSLRSVSGGRQLRYIANGNLLRARAILNGGEIALHTLSGSTENAPQVQGGIVMPAAYTAATASKSDFTIRYPGAAIDYVLALQEVTARARASRYDDSEWTGKADAFKAAQRFPTAITQESVDAIRSTGSILSGPKRGWTLEMSRYDGSLTLYVGKDFPRIIRSKELKALIGDLSKKRNAASYEAKVASSPATITAVIKVLGRNSPLIAPEPAADIVRELSKQHFRADNGKDETQPGTAFSRGESAGGQSVAAVQAAVDAIAAKWVNAPKIVVLTSKTDPNLPADLKDSMNSDYDDMVVGEVEGFIATETNTVYLLADMLATSGDVSRVLMHEVLGHFGLRRIYGDKLGEVLDRMAVLNAAKVRDAAERLGFDYENMAERQAAAEEVLAYMAQHSPELGWVGKAVAAIRSWLRDNITGLSDMQMSDSELIRDYLLPARKFVEGGGNGPKGGSKSSSKAMLSRSIGASLTSGLNNVRDVKLAAGYQVGDLFEGEGRMHWWHKSVGTMYHLAQKSPPFKRVYDSIQNFLNDVSFYAAEAADLAPNILQKLDKIGDVFKSPLSPADTAALSAPVFEGTLSWGRDENGVARPIDEIVESMGATALDDKAHMLMREGHIDPKVLRMWQGLPQDQYESIINGKFEKQFLKPGVVFADKELAEHFKMTAPQIALYREFRAATDKSIDAVAISEMLRYAGDDALPVRDIALESKTATEAGKTLRDYLVSLALEEGSARDKALSDTAAKMLEIAEHAEDMKARGYAPLSRFGQYTLEATLETGERFFSMYETDRERNKASRLLEAARATDIKTGTMSQDSFKLLNGISPETAALFGEMLGLDSQGSEAKDLAYQEFIKRGTANRSAMKRLIHRKGISGFSMDSGRVLASFIYSNARRTSSNLHGKETTRAIDAIPKEQGELKDTAVNLNEYVSNPQEEAQAFRGLLFAQYLGGSVASAMVNATQPFAVTLPYLSQFGGIRAAAAQMVRAVNDAVKEKTGDAALDAALKRAEEEGIVSPQEVHALQAQASGQAQLQSGDGTVTGNALAIGNNTLSRVSLAWGKVFGIAEQFNRRTTFIAAFRTAVAQKHKDPAKFAEQAVNETQFVYNKGNKPQWARGAIGSVLFTFKQYSVNYLELLNRMANAGEPGSPEREAGRRAALLAIAILFLMAGSDGLPFIEDLEDVLDGAMQRLGYNFSSKQRKKEFLVNVLGKGGAEFVSSGLSGLPGMPIDVSGRLGMGNLIPGTGIFQKKADHTRDLMELLGPAGDFAKRSAAASEQLLSGNIGGAANTIAPTAARNVVKAGDMLATGMYRDDRGRKIVDTTAGEAILKGIGFQPHTVKGVQDASFAVQNTKNQYTMAASEIRQAMAIAIFDNDDAAKKKARDSIASWNAKNPTQPMRLNMPAVIEQVKEMRKSKEQRMGDTAPKAIRAQVRSDLREKLS